MTATAYTIQGRTVTLPVCVRDAVQVTAMFPLPTRGVRALVTDARLHVPELVPGWTLGVIAAVEYLDNDLGRYHEVAISFFVEPAAQPSSAFGGLALGLVRGTAGAYIHRLPVTTAFSRDAGRDVWGFPKTVDEIAFEDADGRRRCRLVAGGVHVLTLDVPRGGRGTMRDTPQMAYAVRDGVLYRTASTMGGTGAGFRPGGATLDLGPHPWADELRALGLPRRALMTASVEHMRARFDAPEIL